MTQNNFDSNKYWKERYENGGDSGAGSYGSLAQFKADVINDFMKKNNTNYVFELGCGDSNQLSLYNFPQYYLGVDISEKAINACRDRFEGDATKEFWLNSSNCLFNYGLNIDLSISIDVLFHLIEQDVYDKYIESLFNFSKKYVIIYAWDYESKESEFAPHCKFRRFTKDIEERFKDWKLIETIPQKYPVSEFGSENGSYCDFYIYEKIN